MYYNLMYHHCLTYQIHDEKIYIDASAEIYIERHEILRMNIKLCCSICVFYENTYIIYIHIY